MIAKQKNKRRCKLLLISGLGWVVVSAGLQAHTLQNRTLGGATDLAVVHFIERVLGCAHLFVAVALVCQLGPRRKPSNSQVSTSAQGKDSTAGAAACTLTAGAHTAHGTQDLNWYLLDHPSAMVTVSTCFQQYRQFSTSALHCAVAGYPPVRVRKCESGARMGGNQDIT